MFIWSELKEAMTDQSSDSVANSAHTHTMTRVCTNTTCLRRHFGLSCSCISCPVSSLLSLRLNPGSEQPLWDDAPTLPASPASIWTRVSQLAAGAWSKPADRRHKTDGGEGEGKTRTDADEERRSFCSVMFLWTTMDEWESLNGPLNLQTKAQSLCYKVCVCVWVRPRHKLCYATCCTTCHSRTIVWGTVGDVGTILTYKHE